MALCDNDEGGKAAVKEIAGRLAKPDDVGKFVVVLPGEGCDIERHLVESGFEKQLHDVAMELGLVMTSKPGAAEFRSELLERVRSNKVECAQRLIEKLRASSGAVVVPEPIKGLIEAMRSLVAG
jgi:DNA primase